MKYIVTGGAGFIGSHIQDRLIKDGHDVAVIDNLSSGKQQNVTSESMFFQTDIRDADGVEKAFSEFKPDGVFHLAAQTAVPYSMEHPIEDMQINVIGSMNIFEAAAKHNVSKIVYSNTGGALYGTVGDEALPITEDQPMRLPASYYGTSKYCAEHYLRLIGNIKNVPYVAVRYANVYGPRQDGNHEAGIIAIFTSRMMQGQKVVINGDGSHTRDYVCVLDVVEANMKALAYDKNDYFNVSTGIETSNNEIYQLIADKLGIKEPVEHGPARDGDVLRNVLSNQKAKELLGWEPQYTLEKGLEETIEYYKKNL